MSPRPPAETDYGKAGEVELSDRALRLFARITALAILNARPPRRAHERKADSTLAVSS